MKKFLAILFCFLLPGCVSMPRYHDKEQDISLKLPPNTCFSVEGYETTGDNIKVQRSFSSLKGKLSKAGFEDKEIEIKSHFTDDAWAKDTTELPLSSERAWSLLPPGRALGGTVMGASVPLLIVGWGNGNRAWLLATPLFAVAGFVYGLGLDIYNLVYGLPAVIIKNPWYEYDKELDFTKEILTPTTEFIKTCHSKRGTFIGNNSCLPCLTKKEVISTEEECNRCSNRNWDNFECRAK